MEVIRDISGPQGSPAQAALASVSRFAEGLIRARLASLFAPAPVNPDNDVLAALGRAATLPPHEAVPLVERDFQVARYRADFPILAQTHPTARGPLIYFDNAATTQKPRQVLDAIRHYYETSNANVHRGVHLLAERATQALYDARVKVSRPPPPSAVFPNPWEVYSISFLAHMIQTSVHQRHKSCTWACCFSNRKP